MNTEKHSVKQSSYRQVKAGTKKVTRRPRGKVLTRDAGIFKIVGIGETKEPGGYSWRKHELD